MTGQRVSFLFSVVLTLAVAALPLGAQVKTYNTYNGNRLIPGRINLHRAQRVRVQLPNTPTWLVGFPEGDSAVWFALTNSSRVIKITVDRSGAVITSTTGHSFPNGSMLALDDNAERRILFSAS